MSSLFVLLCSFFNIKLTAFFRLKLLKVLLFLSEPEVTADCIIDGGDCDCVHNIQQEPQGHRHGGHQHIHEERDVVDAVKGGEHQK